jgi:deoxyribodipyrimidine photo-lyase
MYYIYTASPPTLLIQLSAQRAVFAVRATKKHSEGAAAFIEEAVVRRELSDNFCFYNENYDSLEAAAGWAADSLELHSSDARPHIYTQQQLDRGQTHDDLWNAAQVRFRCSYYTNLEVMLSCSLLDGCMTA